LADYLYLWETTAVRQAIEAARTSVSSGGHSSSYWCQQRKLAGRARDIGPVAGEPARERRPETSTLVSITPAQFRVTHDLWAGDPAFAALLERIRLGSPEFVGWWEAHV
jgi:hypothetical protein